MTTTASGHHWSSRPDCHSLNCPGSPYDLGYPCYRSWVFCHGSGTSRFGELFRRVRLSSILSLPQMKRDNTCPAAGWRQPAAGVSFRGQRHCSWHIYTATEIASTSVIPAKAGIHKNPGFPRIKYGAGLVKPGMTNQDNAYVVMYSCSVQELGNPEKCACRGQSFARKNHNMPSAGSGPWVRISKPLGIGHEGPRRTESSRASPVMAGSFTRASVRNSFFT